tara:strand:+ start:1327 stop:2367 length:1041 start_codon:yes stop_codon:yes gene_type:complete
MAVLKSVARITAKLLISLLLLIGACYLLLLVINWQDAEPNADSLHMQNLLQQDALPAAENGYQYFLAHNTNAELLLTGPLQQLDSQCREAGACNASLNTQTDLAELIAQQQPLMAFYQQLLQYPQWQEPPPTLQNIPAYQILLHGQRLFLWQAWLEAQNGNVEQVKTALQADYQFWKVVLANTNNLITKMISVAALERHFNLGTVIFSQLPADQRHAATMPEGWNNAFSDKELSLELAMAGEWHHGSDIMYNTWHGINPYDKSGIKVSEKLLVWLTRPLWLLEDSSNIFANQLQQQAQQVSYPWYSWLRNPVGKILMATGAVHYKDYQQRLLKLEQQRQDALQRLS